VVAEDRDWFDGTPQPEATTISSLDSHPVGEQPLLTQHDQALRHSHVHFWVCQGAAVIGLVSIVAMAAATAIVPNRISLMWLHGLLGVITGAVTFLFFREARLIRARAIALLDRFRADGRWHAAIALTDSIGDPGVRDATKAALALDAIEHPTVPASYRESGRDDGFAIYRSAAVARDRSSGQTWRAIP